MTTIDDRAMSVEPRAQPPVHRPLAAYLPIAEHGVVGDLHSAALVGTDGTIDWYCPERFDAPAVFGAILDRYRGGFYRVAPAYADAQPKQLYLPDTNVLITRFLSLDGVGEVHDFMPIDAGPQRLVRRVVAVRGAMRFRLELEPRFDYARDTHEVKLVPGHVRFISAHATLAFSGPTELTLQRTPGGVRLEFELQRGESHAFVLQTGGSVGPLGEEQADALERATADYWRGWLARSTYSGRWRETVHRSALALKLLSYQPTGAMVAAPTTSLPERIGGPRNWDYRFTWVRDFAFSLHALLRLGFADEAQDVMKALTSLSEVDPAESSDRPMLQVLYGIDPRSQLAEEELDHLEGYRGSRPVRIGNAAADQLQLDIYGGLLDALRITEQAGSQRLLPYDAWRAVIRTVDWVCKHWQEPDEGIWEVRNGRRRFTYSRLMCWVALDRAIRIAARRGLPAPLARWTTQRDAIYLWIMDRGWSQRREAFVQSEDSDVLDASLLLMPLVHFIGPTDPRWLSTLDAIGRELVSDSLVYRYDPRAAPDGLDGDEATFSMCTFWYVECLARAGRLEEAQLALEMMLTYANHVGLYSEQIGRNGELLGNFPQAFTHLGLISAAISLDRQLSRQATRPTRT
jgi:GH15 family glucan-1,4-alpha-glucosidase